MSSPPKKDAPAGWVIAVGIAMMGASAGLTLYTKKTGSMLATMKKVQENQLVRRGPVKFGPPTRAEWEKMRPRWDKNDDFI
jgi:hypothetical protein